MNSCAPQITVAKPGDREVVLAAVGGAQAKVVLQVADQQRQAEAIPAITSPKAISAVRV